jgi:hypothetical protein
LSEDPREIINQLIIEADADLQARNIEQAFEKYKLAKSKAETINWQERVMQIDQMISDFNKKEAEKKKELEMKKKHEDEQKKKEEEEKKMAAARQRLMGKQELERQQKMDALKKKKEQEEKLSTEAYDYLEKGSNSTKAQNYQEAIESFSKAKDLFNSINWVAEVARVQELIDDTNRDFEKYTKKVDEEKKKEAILKEALIKHEETIKNEAKQASRTIEIEANKAKALEMKSISANELSQKAFTLMDSGNQFASQNKFGQAISAFHEAKQIFTEIGWTAEADKVLAQISIFRDKQKKCELEEKRKEEFVQKEKEEQDALQKQIDLSQRLKERKEKESEEKLRKESEDKAYAQSIADQVFKSIDDIELEIKKYQDEVKKGRILALDCPYQKAIDAYRKGQKELRDIGWMEQSERLGDGIRTYLELQARDQKLRETEKTRIDSKKQEEFELQKQIELSQRMKAKQDKERKEAIQQELGKAERDRNTHNECLSLLDNAQVLVNKQEFNQALEIYRNVLVKYQSIDYSDGVRLTRDTIIRVEQEAATFYAKKELMQKVLEEREREKQELEQKILQSKEESERKRLEIQKKMLDEQSAKGREAQIQDEIIDNLEKAGSFLLKNQFDDAIVCYNSSLELLKEIVWPMKREQIMEAIEDAKKKKHIFIEKQRLAQEQKEKELVEKRALEEKILVMEAERKARQEEAKKLALKQRSKVEQEKILADEAWKLLDVAENQIKNQKEYLSLYYFHHALSNFEEIGWAREAGVAKKRLMEVFSKINSPVLDLQELLANKQLEEEKSLIETVSNMITSESKKEYSSAFKQLTVSLEILQKLKWVKSFNLIQKLEDIYKEKEKEHMQFLLNKEKMPSEENALRLLDKAKIKIERMQYEEGISLGEQAKAMFEKMGWEREANMVNQEMIRWKFKAEKITDQIKAAQEMLEEKENSSPAAESMQYLSEEERRKAILEERKRARRDGKKS